MRSVVWTDRSGYKHRSWVRDGDPDYMAEQGVRQDPPSLDELDWEGVKRDLHNALVEAGIITWLDVQRGDVRALILKAMHRRLQALYREVTDNG